MISLIKLFCTGIFIGAANVVPGVSGGTIAVICNVYDKLIILSSLQFRQIKAQWKELGCLAFGLGAGIVLFAKLITFLFSAYPAQINFFFIGVIVGSIPFLYKKVQTAVLGAGSGTRFSAGSIVAAVCGLAGLALMLGMFFLQRRGISAAVAVTAFTPAFAVKLIAAGAIAACAMLIPGISGSFVLLVLGAYQTVLQAVSDFNIPLLIPIGIGVAAGLVLSARLIDFLLKRFPAPVYGFILGLVAGSVVYLYPQVCQPFTLRLISAALLFGGYSLVSFFSKQENGA